MQRIQLETVSPRFLTDEELAHYITLHAAGELPLEWVGELIQRFVKLLDATADHPQN
jgi:hypothetical protein